MEPFPRLQQVVEAGGGWGGTAGVGAIGAGGRGKRPREQEQPQSRAKGLTVPDLPKELAEDTNLLSAFQTSGGAGASSDSECDRLTPSFLR